MQRKIILFGFFILVSSLFFAQKERVQYLQTFDDKPFHYGFYLGLNQNDFKLNLNNLNSNDISTSSIIGFNVGLIADIRLYKNLSLRLEPGLITNPRDLVLNTPANSKRDANSRYLHLPLIFKFSANRIHNYRPYLLAGVSYDYNFNSAQGTDKLGMTSSNFMYEIGFGVDFYLFFVKLSPSIRGVFAINNEIKYDGSQASDVANIDFLGTRGIFLNLAFEGFNFKNIKSMLK